MAIGRASGLLVLAAVGAVIGVGTGGLAQAAPAASRACQRRTLGPVVANVPSVEVQPQFRLNGQRFPGAAAGVAVFTLWASEPSDLFDGPLARHSSDSGSMSTAIVPSA